LRGNADSLKERNVGIAVRIRHQQRPSGAHGGRRVAQEAGPVLLRSRQPVQDTH
jgi:hypothetical protein